MKSKRFFDLIAAIIGFFIVLPLCFALSLLIWRRIGSPVFFCQIRPGLCGQPFRMVKFRTMTDKRDEKGELLPDDKRLTKFGRFLRAPVSMSFRSC